MIQELDFYCALQGANLDPAPLVSADKFEILEYNRAGEVAKKGRFKGRPLDFGNIRFKSREGDLEEFVNALHSSRKLIIDNGSEISELHILLKYEGQCNWEIAPSLLKMIGELGLTLTITCYEANDADVIK
jgi:hypothetical protein